MPPPLVAAVAAWAGQSPINVRASAVSALCAVLYSSRAAASSAATVFAAAARAAPHCRRAACPAPAATHACQRGMSCASSTPCADAIAR